MECFGKQLLFPAEFVGRGDMSRGGLMLRCVSAGVAYIHAFGPSGSPWLQAPKLARRPLEACQCLPPVGLPPNCSSI